MQIQVPQRLYSRHISVTKIPSSSWSSMRQISMCKMQQASLLSCILLLCPRSKLLICWLMRLQMWLFKTSTSLMRSSGPPGINSATSCRSFLNGALIPATNRPTAWLRSCGRLSSAMKRSLTTSLTTTHGSMPKTRWVRLHFTRLWVRTTTKLLRSSWLQVATKTSKIIWVRRPFSQPLTKARTILLKY